MSETTFARPVNHIAQAMAEVQRHREPRCDVSGRIRCPKCRGALLFNVQSSGISKGRCSAGCGVSWVN